ncbi:pentatricopeptide repeat-containing protein At1g71420 [Rosa chinensis]|uniref:pentatricopeptide repeat-containing protein At1g71420 n=1 Tax=Rosa chinensis TaxID=74649 RepID=UPI000D08FA73|nr:pentatricopeptide repeat-containing protein At1g71420 [Rosa chinensis]
MLAHYLPNEFAFASVLSSCVDSDGGHGRQVHGLALKMSLDACVYVANALITMYSKLCDHGGVFDVSRDEAWKDFSVVDLELKLLICLYFVQMHLDGLEFDRATLLSVFSSLNGVNGIDDMVVTRFCYQLHCLVIKTGFILGTEVVTALVKAYSNLGGNVADCYRLFSETSCHRDIVAWTGIMSIFSERDPEEALSLFRQLRRENLAPDRYTFSIVLKAYASLATEPHASAVHSQVIKGGSGGDTVLANALIHAYARCGSISLSKQVFDGIEFHDVVSWNTMLKAYALYGQAAEALVGEAEKLVSRMPMEPDSVVWSALLGSCRKHGNTQLAKLAADRLKELAPEGSLVDVQMSNIYSSDDNFGEAGLIRKEMKGSRVKKEPGLS